jgi:hypothetical protein
LVIALQHIGHVLRYSPPDPDGLWIHHSAAQVLNAKDASEIRKGFEIELLKEIAASYDREAEHNVVTAHIESEILQD